MKKNFKFYTVDEFAEILRVHYNTVYRGIRCGRIQAFRVGTGKKSSYRIPEHEATRMMEFDANEIIGKMVEERVRKGK